MHFPRFKYLNDESQVDIVTSRSFPNSFPVVLVRDIDTLEMQMTSNTFQKKRTSNIQPHPTIPYHLDSEMSRC